MYKINSTILFLIGISVASFGQKVIDTSVDKFTGDTTISTPEIEGFTFFKMKEKGKSFLFMSKVQRENFLSVENKGFWLLLENNQKFAKPDVEISVEVASHGSGYMYTANMDLSETDIKLLSENLATDSRMYIFERKVQEAKKIVEYLKAIAKE